MGAADAVPGVSGGTVALILGHYQRLVTAISHIDFEFLQMAKQRRFRAAAEHVDLRFLMALGLGIATGIVSLIGLVHWLLEFRYSETLAVFLGLVLASVWVVRCYVQAWKGSRIVAAMAGAVVAMGICLLPTSTGSASLPFLFLSGSIAICAMILPGISGAFVLLLLGVYQPITTVLKTFFKDLVHGNFEWDAFIQIVVFCAGCGFGLLAFSRLLRWLLEHHGDVTMAGLIGLMIGSVGRLWPLQAPTPETADLEMKYRVMQYFSPADWSGTSMLTLIALAVAAALAVIVIEKIGDANASCSR